MRLVGTRPYLTTETPFYMSSVSFVILLLLLSVAALVESASVCTFEGGWSLRVDANNCPVDAPVNCGKGLQQRCCPPGLACAGEGDFEGNYCCKAGEDCTSQASSSPQCPDPTYTLWGGNGTLENGGFCCEPGSNGFYQGKMEGVGCTAADVRTLPTDEYFASTVRTVACARSASSSLSPSIPTDSAPTATTAPAGSSSAPSSSLSGGAIAGIAVGAVCGVGIVAGLLALSQRRKRGERDKISQNGDHIAAPGAGGYRAPVLVRQHGEPQSPHDDAAVGGGNHSPARHEQQKDASELSGVRSPTELPSEQMRHEMANGMAPGAFHEME